MGYRNYYNAALAAAQKKSFCPVSRSLAPTFMKIFFIMRLPWDRPCFIIQHMQGQTLSEQPCFYKRRGKPSPRSSHEPLHKSQKRTSRIRLLFRFVVSSATPSPGGKPPSPHFNQYSSYCSSVKNRDRPCFFKPLKLTNRFQLRSVPVLIKSI